MARAALLLLALGCGAVATEDLSNGWGSTISWTPWADARSVAAASGKPIMLIIHKSWCGACKALKPVFAGSADIALHSNEFVMVNTPDAEEPSGSEFTPDGGYIPRIFFLAPSGEVMTSVTNAQGNPQYKYYYATPDSILKSMADALQAVKGAAAAQAEETASEL